jgi:hypothetical protein
LNPTKGADMYIELKLPEKILGWQIKVFKTMYETKEIQIWLGVIDGDCRIQSV